jgi:multiple sugar transport system ATP-binding protein
MAPVKFEDVYKMYPNGYTAIKNLCLDIKDGEFLVFVGPSGCGKSTALRILAGLESISAGKLWIGDRLVNDLTPQQRSIAMVFQNYALYPHMSVRQNLDFPLRMLRLTPKQRQGLIAEAAAKLGLETLLDHKPRQLSGGQRQRVAMGRALVRNPEVFLLDEPLSNLDAKMRTQIRTEIADLQRRLETTMVYVTHDQTEAMTMGDRVAVMRGGELQQIATPQELYDHPANIFVASFIGSPAMNIFKTRLQKTGEAGLSIQFGDYHLPLPAQVLQRYPQLVCLERYLDQPLLAGLRPEAFALAAATPHTASIQVELRAVEALGHETMLYAESPAPLMQVEDTAPGSITSSIEGDFDPHPPGTLVARVAATRDLHPQTRVNLSIDLEKLYLFPDADQPERGKLL